MDDATVAILVSSYETVDVTKLFLHLVATSSTKMDLALFADREAIYQEEYVYQLTLNVLTSTSTN